MTRTVSCPRCKTAVLWESSNRYRPFCSAACREGDLGAWASGQYVITTPADPESLEEVQLKPSDTL